MPSTQAPPRNHQPPQPINTSLALPPQNLDAEKSVLGSIMLDANAIDAVSGTLRPDHFYRDSNRVIYATLLELRNAAKPVDTLTLADELTRRKQYEEVGGEEYLGEILDSVPHSAHASYYASLVIATSVRRSVITSSTDSLRAAYDQSIDLDELLSRSEAALHSVIESRIGNTVSTRISDVFIATMDSISAKRKLGTLTGFCDVDDMTNGMQPGSLIILAARPSVGKTSFAGNICVQAAQHGTPVLFVSLEQSRVELASRFLSWGTGIDSKTVASRNFTEMQADMLVQKSVELSALPIDIDDTTPRNLTQISAVARLLKRRNKLGLIIVDYLQLISAEDKRTPREQQVAEITRGLKSLARSLELPIIALAQLNRQIETRTDRRPKLSDLRESGAIEQDADMVWFLDRPGSYDEKADPSVASLIIAKHRNGQTGIIDLNWSASTMTFRNAARESQADYGSHYFPERSDRNF